MKFIVYILSVILLLSCSSSKNTFYQEQPQVNLYAFVGKKISVEKFDATVKGPITKYFDKELNDSVSSQKISISLDGAYHCTYLVLKPVFNKLTSDTIRFNAFTHHESLGFNDLEYVLLYISQDSTGSFYHQKYQYDPLKRSKGYFGINGETLEYLFNKRKLEVFTRRGIF